MIKDKTLTQKTGDNSTNFQAEVIVVNSGLSYTDAKEIALDVFKQNFLKLSSEAASIALQRAESLINDFLAQLQATNVQGFSSLNAPGMQYSIYLAQMEYAKSGDKKLAQILINVLLDRVNQKERNLKQIVLDESLLVIPKLTASQLDTLTVVLLLRYYIQPTTRTIEQLKEYFEVSVLPFIDSVSKNDSIYQHLEYAGCGAITMHERSLSYDIINNYNGIFSQGFSKEEFDTKIGSFDSYRNLLTSCSQDSMKYQFNAVNRQHLRDKAIHSGVSNSILQKMINLMDITLLRNVSDIVKELYDVLPGLNDKWENSSISRMSLTSVGIAIGNANYKRKTGINIDLDTWMN